MTDACCTPCPYSPRLIRQVLRANRSCDSMTEAVEAVLKNYAAKPVWSGKAGVLVESAKLYWSTMAMDIEQAMKQGGTPEEIAARICPFAQKDEESL